MKNFKLYLIINVLVFYVLPFVGFTLDMYLLLVVINPILCFVTAFAFGRKHRFDWLYSIIVALLFIPSMFIYYNYTATYLAFVYCLFSIIGNFLGDRTGKKLITS